MSREVKQVLFFARTGRFGRQQFVGALDYEWITPFRLALRSLAEPNLMHREEWQGLERYSLRGQPHG